MSGGAWNMFVLLLIEGRQPRWTSFSAAVSDVMDYPDRKVALRSAIVCGDIRYGYAAIVDFYMQEGFPRAVPADRLLHRPPPTPVVVAVKFGRP